MWEATEEDCTDGANIGDDVDLATNEVLRSHLNIPFVGTACREKCAALVFHGDAVEVLFLVIGPSDENGGSVFDGVLKHGLANVDDVITAVAWAVGVQGGWEDARMFACLGEEELLDVVDECIAVLAE